VLQKPSVKNAALREI